MFILLRLLLWLPLWLLGLVFFLLGLGLSPWGTAWLISQGEQRGLLSVESVEGAPLDDLTLTGLEMTAGPADVRIERLHLAWSEDCVFAGKLCMDALQLENVDVHVHDSAPDSEAPAEEERGDGGLPSIAVPFPIELRDIQLNDVKVQLADGARLSWQHFSTGAELVGNRFTLHPTRLDDSELYLPPTPGQALAVSGGEQPSPRLLADSIEAANAVIEQPAVEMANAPSAGTEKEQDERPLDEQVPLSLPEIELPLAFEVPSLIIEDFRIRGAARHQVERLAVTLRGSGHDIDLESLALASSEADAELAAKVSLRDDYPLALDLDARIRRQPVAGQRVTLNLEGSLEDLVAELDASGPIPAQLKARADVLDPARPFDVTLKAERLKWPLAGMPPAKDDEAAAGTESQQQEQEDTTTDETGEPQNGQTTGDRYLVENLLLNAEGDLTDYQAALSARVSGSALPETLQLALKGHGDLEQFSWMPLSIATDSGSLISRGQARWSPALDVKATLNLSDFDLAAVTQAVDGRLNGDAQAHFAMNEAGQWQLQVPELAIDGTLQQRPLALNAELSGNSDMRWDVKELRLRQGDNHLTAQGRIAEKIDLSGELDAPALGTLLPELGGRARGQFSLGGTLQAPQVDLSLDGQGLRYAENRLDSLQLDADVEGLEDPALDVTLDITGLDAAGQRFSSLGLNLDGRLSEHLLDFSADAAEDMPLSRAALTLKGGLDAQRTRYRGSLTALEVDSEQAAMRLDDPLDFVANLDAGSVKAEPFCLVRRQGGRLCATETLQASAQRGKATLALRDFPMDLVGAALPAGWQAGGETNGEIEASWSEGGRWSAQVDLQSRFDLRGRDAYDQPWSLPATTLNVDLEASDARAQVQTRLELAQAGALRLDLQIDDPTGAAALDGRLRIDDLQLSPYRNLTAALEQLEGSLNADVAVGGKLTDPRLNGALRLTDLRASGDDIPVEARDGRLVVQLQGESADITGFVEAEEGRINLRGDASWPEPGQWAAELSLDGTESPLLVALPEFGRLRVAPDINVNANPELLRIRGEVRVPWGRLSVAGGSPPAATAPSSDEVIITREDEEAARREAKQAVQKAGEGADEATSQALADAGMQLDVNVDLVLGPDVQLEAFGLETGLDGQLQIRQGSGPVQLFGDVNLEDGRYKAFGQDLLIRRGQVLFSGPASQPRLQFEAIRNPEATEDDVIAGLRVTGPAQQPALDVFSEPAMNESRALSYLLRGRAPEDSGPGAESALTSALIGLSLSRTGNAVGQVGEAFGIDDLSLEAAGSGDDSQVVVSGYLFDDLKVSYGVGVFSPIAELTLRYKLLQDLYVQAVSGASQAVDLIYTFSLGRSDEAP